MLQIDQFVQPLAELSALCYPTGFGPIQAPEIASESLQIPATVFRSFASRIKRLGFVQTGLQIIVATRTLKTSVSRLAFLLRHSQQHLIAFIIYQCFNLLNQASSSGEFLESAK